MCQYDKHLVFDNLKHILWCSNWRKSFPDCVLQKCRFFPRRLTLQRLQSKIANGFESVKKEKIRWIKCTENTLNPHKISVANLHRQIHVSAFMWTEWLLLILTEEHEQKTRKGKRTDVKPTGLSTHAKKLVLRSSCFTQVHLEVFPSFNQHLFLSLKVWFSVDLLSVFSLNEMSPEGKCIECHCSSISLSSPCHVDHC